ncbi:acyl-CoA N-acyltransferase [Chaetomium tenue]|uniref:Acyl-CoA N-acyltransferase n=1 Tax=Chaetomium tenue TaxID=1854479 RepID=A0ACB7P7Q2_9PEZI|nr:acyl-CoA N-acyltransferase [Chaetomium globosum]
MGGGPVGPKRPLVRRQATKADLDAIFKVVKDGFPDDPGCNYKFPNRDQYPHDFEKWTRLEYAEYMDQPEKFASFVITATEYDLVDEPIAIGVWDISVTTKAKGGDRGINERRDANREHMVAYGEAMTENFDKFFARYGEEQLHLWMLITHPDFRRRGAGTQLCNWGVEEAARRGGWILTVMASPMGKNLYDHLGYNLVGYGTAQVDGEAEKVDIYALEMPQL